MITLLCFDDFEAFSVLPVIFAAIFVAVIVAVIAVATNRAKAETQRRQDEYKKQSIFTDGNGRTSAQRDYLAEKRRQLAERKTQSGDKSHSHTGNKVEKYDRIVGSLGEVNDEGCDELDGVRLIEHDESYCDDPDHIITTEPTELERAIILGEVLNTPRYKQMYRRK